MWSSSDDLIADDTCPPCGFDAGTTYEAENGRFCIFCASCGYPTERTPIWTSRGWSGWGSGMTT